MRFVETPEVSDSFLDRNDVPDAVVGDVDVDRAMRIYSRRLNHGKERADAYTRFMLSEHKRMSDPKHFATTVVEWAKVFGNYSKSGNPLSTEERNWLRSKKTRPMPESLELLLKSWQKAVRGD